MNKPAKQSSIIFEQRIAEKQIARAELYSSAAAIKQYAQQQRNVMQKISVSKRPLVASF